MPLVVKQFTQTITYIQWWTPAHSEHNVAVQLVSANESHGSVARRNEGGASAARKRSPHSHHAGIVKIRGATLRGFVVHYFQYFH